MTRRSSRKSQPKDAGDKLKMVLKINAREQLDEDRVASPAVSLASDESDQELVNKSNGKRTKKAHTDSPVPKQSRKDSTVGITAMDFSPAERNLRDRSKPVSPKPQSTALYDTLLYLQKLMERKDNQRFFAFPINDMIAPGYSKVIKKPMDFSTMKDKIERKEYNNLMEYKADIKLICVNAMNYNHPDTIYYKAAQKLLEYAMKTMSKDRLLTMRKSQPIMSQLLDSEMALHLDVDASDYIAPSRTQKRQKDSNAYLTFEPVPDHLPAKDIVAIAKERAAEAAEHLAKTQPKSRIGFLNRAADGTTMLNFINPDSRGYVSDRERVITLGDKIGKLRSGRSFLESINVENDYTEAKPVHYLDYGPYATGTPNHDSSFATLTKKETDLLLSFYGTQNSLDYIKSLRTFVADSSDSMIQMIENLIDSRTGGKHSQAQKALKDMRSRSQDDEQPAPEKIQEDQPLAAVASSQPSSANDKPVDFESLKSLADLGIDTSFIEHFEKEDKDGIQEKLDETAEQVEKLSQLQHNRLSQAPSFTPVNNTTASTMDKEEQAVNDISSALCTLTRNAKPEEVTDKKALQSALGVGLVDWRESKADKVDETMRGVCETSNFNNSICNTETLDHHIPLNKSPTSN